ADRAYFAALMRRHADPAHDERMRRLDGPF
ncbi:MAG: hypothetical protein JWL97_3909, partial [Gemmatimonadales bacterium]|nr:hypothetical protein [Gemmatimonadales bacterium]